MSEYDQPDAPSNALERPPWRRHAGFLGVTFGVAAAVIAAGLRFTPSASAYSGVEPWAVIGVLGFLLVLVGAGLLFAAALPATGGDTDAPTGRILSMLGTLLGAVGVGLAAIAVALAIMVPTPTQSIMVQFTELVGRVQLEYCPTLPASFAGTASHADLAEATTILPVKISADTCGNPDYTDGVWIYLNRAAVTVSARP